MIISIGVKHYHKFKTKTGDIIETEPVKICFFKNKEDSKDWFPSHIHEIGDGFVYRGGNY